ncbi:DUF4097 family beta strand repeat-containing protein [Deinococcus maricopensis]|uniref:DUF4097 domain-containing protein n=1 Tax=Deinococcus maricopensis (strain DSM 21211 / LMG 22137 / NRRL B-23946 / LB-34) TaxID=709986 RepID=E8U6T4_DEIML|nr:DUF4097 family beta strand repeat-containing protein [Deinococcus maricopensis]ADV66773.1 hypothetical protein Deima_1121 [Deinococcus maricopensis DSM 21211]
MLPTRPTPYPFGAAFARIGISAALIVACTGLAALTLSTERVPGLRVVTTPVNVPLGQAKRATLDVNATGANLVLNTSGELGAGDLLTGGVRRRAHSALSVSAKPDGDTLGARINLTVPPRAPNIVVFGFSSSVQHALRATLSRAVPTSLTTTTTWGDQALNLTQTRLNSLRAQTESGDLAVTLPAARTGDAHVRSSSGDVSLSAASTPTRTALEVRTNSGDLHATLGGPTDATLTTASGDLTVGARADTRGTLKAQTGSGDLNVRIAGRARTTFSTSSGDLSVNVQPGTRGTLAARTGSGSLTVTVPAGTRLRITARTRLGDLNLPRGLVARGDTYTTPGGNADLTLTLDAGIGDIEVRTTGGAQ